jgi:hypothetical protein
MHSTTVNPTIVFITHPSKELRNISQCHTHRYSKRPPWHHDSLLRSPPSPRQQKQAAARGRCRAIHRAATRQRPPPSNNHTTPAAGKLPMHAEIFAKRATSKRVVRKYSNGNGLRRTPFKTTLNSNHIRQLNKNWLHNPVLMTTMSHRNSFNCTASLNYPERQSELSHRMISTIRRQSPDSPINESLQPNV